MLCLFAEEQETDKRGDRSRRQTREEIEAGDRQVDISRRHTRQEIEAGDKQDRR